MRLIKRSSTNFKKLHINGVSLLAGDNRQWIQDIFIFLSDQYFIDFPDSKLMQNKENR